jgi:hypothetical protein
MVMTSVHPRFSEGGIDTDSERDAALKAKQSKRSCVFFSSCGCKAFETEYHISDE